ncbi:MAG: lipoyl synthase [SAR86 cluster bacterium BACL1 MAG-121105-bin34]|jgi:lipoyl synthase|nr:MAG: lipoyl synthase [SAR86 cluster bacterium BACL1 MAG-120507-bin14]KRP00274.1 MAG: lipoyl synthase [SAR86 cluster bacterium BACL1 MAG-120813-bin36]KRP00959.1 MAG: lipoyl synthase [SAR86 cluster bacterium BACL1 MAG-120924-bin88]KRP11980.1 MAG: lipoyl synthase [SAR86 cluster bacterium BACL1 MAG-121105-bin34]KRP15271.1 MAG: lipoyl synthase [SAR86 cluster bacterium BACL1 MAG-121128-bin56]KRP20595.1 MAG: lipoyl synthase [SAR86 cluster bacterium BACL1 MAG-121022-bin58]KRP23101.1 MAG: lipoyl sy
MEIIPTQKIVNRDGIKAVKNGQKANQYSSIPNQKKPEWIRVKATFDKNFKAVKKQVQDKRLNTVCEEAMCPNISECWSAGTATFMLMGSVCTRACKFCSVDTGNPKGWLDLDEPMHTAQAVKTMGLKYVVLTSVNRDDLEDGGAEHYAQTVKAIKELNPETAVEALTPDFKGLASSIETLVNCGLEVFAQNVETVRRLTHPVRDIRAGYEQTLEVLAESKRINPKVLTKTSLILGLGETDAEIEETMDDLIANQVDILTLGQYLRPTLNHLPVERWVTPKEFEAYREIGLAKGFLEVVSGPMVRSSYRAERALQKNNAGL